LGRPAGLFLGLGVPFSDFLCQSIKAGFVLFLLAFGWFFFCALFALLCGLGNSTKQPDYKKDNQRRKLS
jgi:phosphotransferase system  glucose/maltose/N-acetylglucosamine-specific IIC component